MNQYDELTPLLEGAVLGLFRNPPTGSKTVPSVFLSSLYSSLEVVWDPNMPTAATNGKKLFLGVEFFKSLSAPMRVTLLAHEIWHAAFLHMDRVGARCHKVWNMACDHAINLMLKEYGYTFDIDHLADPKFTGMSADQIYDQLIKDGEPINLPFGDDIVEPSDGAGQEDHSTHVQEVLSNVLRAAQLSKMSGDKPGSLPGELESTIDSLLNPKMPWEVLLRRWFQEIGEPAYTWKTPNRRHIANGMYLPGMLDNDDGLSHIVWACDSSGSVSDEQLQLMNSEITGVQERFNPEKMTLMVFDTRVNEIREFKKEEAIPPMTFTGRGGTDLHDLWKQAERAKPKALVVFSDLECSIPPALPGIPVLWVCIDNPTRTVPYGQLVHVNSA